MILWMRTVARVPAGAETAEGADLEDAPVALLGLDHGAALGDEAGHRLLAEHVLAGLHRGDGDQGVPTAEAWRWPPRRCPALQHAAEVGVDRQVFAR